MAISLTDDGLTLSDGTTLSSATFNTDKIVQAETGTNRSLGGDSGWVDHLSVTFTVTESCAIRCIATFGPSYESGPVTGQARFILDNTTTSPECHVAKQLSINKATGPHGMTSGFNAVNPGSHTVKLQVRNYTGSTTWILNYWGDSDRLIVGYK